MNKKILFWSVILFTLAVSFAEAQYVPPDKIIMLWDYNSGDETQPPPENRIIPDGLDVISPTWFSLSSGEGDIFSLADSEYVAWAHNNGVKVWALLENRSDNLMTYWALFSESKRKKIIGQITGFVRDYGLDGINIDFEQIKPGTGKLFENFIVELYAQLKTMGVTLSVDIPFPLADISGVYDLALIAENSDYLVLMAYDQHNVDSEHIGAVAAISWVKQGIEDALSRVSSDKIILGIPFFTRVWIEDSSGGILTVSSELEGMKDAYETFDKAARIWGRDRATAQIYAEYSQGSKRYKTWLEDEHSISLKLDTINDYELAGMSAWRSGWEMPGIWDLVNSYFE